MRSETRYERVGMGREERAEVVDQRCRPKCFCFQSRTKKATGKSGSSILVNFRPENEYPLDQFFCFVFDELVNGCCVCVADENEEFVERVIKGV